MVKKGDTASEAGSETTDGADLNYARRLFAAASMTSPACWRRSPARRGPSPGR